MFEYQGQELSVEDIQAVASKAGMSYEDTLKALTDKGMVEKGKQEKPRIKTWGGLVDFEVDPEQEPMNNFVLDKVARLAQSGVSLVNEVLKAYESGEGGFMMEQIYEGPLTAFAGEIAQDLRDKGVDVPEKFGWYDLTSFETRRSMYEDHMIESAKKGMSIEEIQRLDPTNKIKLEDALKWWDKHTYDVDVDENGKPIDYVDLFSKGEITKGLDAFSQDLAAGAPSIIVSRIPILGPAILGTSAYMSNFEEELYDRLGDEKDDGTKITRDDIVKNSIISGGADFVSEYFGGKVLNRIIGRGVPKDQIEKILTQAPKEFMKKVGLGYVSEFATEGGAGIIREYADALTYGDDKGIKDYFRTFIKDGFVGGFLGAGTTATLSGTNKNDIYEYVSPATYKKAQLKIESEIIKTKQSLAKANESEKPYLKRKLKSLQDQKQKNKDNLINFFDSMTDERKKKYAQNIDRQHEALNIIGNNKYTESEQESANQELKKYTEANSKFFTGIDVKYDAELEAAVGRVTKSAERIRAQKDIFGFSRKNLDIKYINTNEQLQEVIKQNPGLAAIASSDGLFTGKTKDGKPVIYVNTMIASATGQTNVLGHEFLHAIVSSAFKESGIGRENLKNSVSAFAQYLRETGNQDVLDTIENRLAENYGALTQDGEILRDANLNIVQFDSKNQDKYEEYFNIFSDIISKKKIKNIPGKDKGIIKSFSTLLKGFGFNSVDFQDGKQVFDFLVDYNKNINREGVLGRIVARTIQRTKLKGLEAKSVEDRVDSVKKSVSKDIDTELVKDTSFENKIQKLYQDPATWIDIEEAYKPRIKRILRANYSWIEDLDNQNNTNKLEAVIEEAVGPNRGILEMITKYNPETGVPLSGYIGSIMKKRGLMEYVQREFPEGVIQQNLGAREDVQKQVAKVEAEQDIEADIETEDLSLVGQAKIKAKKTERQSKLRRQFGFETGGNMYNKVINSAKKSVLLAYRKTQSITDPAKRARAIKDLLRKEYFTSGLTSDLFKDIKNFLGTKDYIKNLKQYREAIVESMSTADLVQIERKVPDNERIFTVFDKKLTKIEDVVDAVDKGLLPTEAINTIKKGTAVNLYRKRMPTEQELVSFADQPAINPVTGARSGLKGTRKDGFAKAISNTLVLDAVMEVRQSEDVVEALEDDAIAQLDLMALSDAVGREVDVKFSKSTAVTDINNAIDNNINLAVYSQIKFSRSHRKAYEARLTKKRTDLDENQIKGAVESIFKFVEGQNIPNNKRAKFEKMAMHYMANGYLILPEDGYKVIEAERIATIKKIDPFSYKNPNELIERFVGEVKGARTNPDTVKEFTNKTDVGSGVTVYDVADSKEGQEAVRNVIDTHFGKKANPWCLAARQGEYYGSDQAYSEQERDQMVADQEAVGRSVQVEKFIEDGQTVYELTITTKPDPNNELKESFNHWKNYNKKGNGFKIAFKNGKLLCFRDGNKKQWWDRNDRASDKIHFTVKEVKGDVESTFSVMPEDGTKTLTQRIKGKMPNAEVFTLDDNIYYNIKSNTTYVNGAIVKQKTETAYKDSKMGTGVYVSGEATDTSAPDMQLSKITKDVETLDGDILTKELEGTVALASGPYKVYEDIKVKINHVTNVRTGGTQSITVNGISHSVDVKFSKSAAEVNYNKVLNNIKFSRKKQDPYIADQLNIARELGNTSDEIIYARLEQELKNGTPLQEAHAVAFKEAYGDQAAEIIQQDGNSVKDLQQNINKFYLPKVRAFAKKVALKKYAKLIKATKDVEAQQDLINSFLINYGRPIRSGKVLNITTNRALLAEMEQAFGKETMRPYELVSVQSGEKVMVNGKDIDLYKSITPIKSDPARYVDKVNEQADLAKKFLFEDILQDNNLSNGEKKALVQLIFYGQKGPGRKLYKFGTYVEGMPVSKTTLEHEITANDMHNAIIDVIDGKMDIDRLSDIIDNAYVHVLPKDINNIFKKLGKTSKRNLQGYNSMPEVLEYLQTLDLKGNTATLDFSRTKDLKTLNNAMQFSRSTKNPTKGITVLDFDDTLATSKSLVKFTRPDGSKGTLTPEQYASTYEDLSDLGYEFDFSEFSKVVDGKPAPLLNKAKKLAGKFGTKDMFVLTARPADSAPAIREFLKQNGLDIPLKNITGLGNSTAEAKALWVADKVADGYNDFYFADDALKNVQAVQNMLDQFDVKSKVQQARIKFSRTMSDDFNQMLERTKGVPFDETFSRARALKLGKNKGKFQIFVPPSADDFEGLLYYFVGKGEQGNKDLEFFKKAVIDPFSRAYTELDQSRQTIINDWNNLRKRHSEVANKLGKLMPASEFTFDNAIRVYLYNKAGHDIPGLSEQEVNNMVERVKTDRALLAFAENLQVILKLDDVYVKPNEYWTAGSTASDVQEVSERIRRAEFLGEWIENKNEIFNEANLNKIEATYGSRFRSALEDVLYRMETGRTRSEGSADAISSRWMRWLNNSVGAIMFINVKSALLQTISMINYVNYVDNNPFQAAKAFVNQKQYWADFTMIFNSDFLKQRRKGLKTDVQTAEIASAVANATNKAQAAVAYLLKKGFLPTQIADSFAIAAGGATFYRNRVKTYLNEGLSQKEAEEKAFNDFRNSTEESQQSARPDRLSQQQVSNAGRLLLNFQNYPMQQARLFKKAIIGLARGTGDRKQHLSRIVFYGFAQNMIFLSLQNALFAMLFDHEDEEEEQKLFDTKMERILNGMVDTMLRGSGITGGVIATAKNTMLKAMQELDKKGRGEYGNVLLEALNLSPAIGSKLRKIGKGYKNYDWNRDAVNEMSKLDIDNPIWTTAAPVIEGVTNAPTDRSIRLINQVREGFNPDNSVAQRITMLLGFSPYEIGVKPIGKKKVEEAKKESKKEKKSKKVRCRAFSSSGGRCKNTTTNKSGLCYAHD